MIIRAVSSDEEDDAMALPFPADAASHDRNERSSAISSSTAVKVAWLGVCCALVALLLLDLAALLNQLFPTLATASLEPRRPDPFSILSWILACWRGEGTAEQAVAPATVLNNTIGQLFVCAWIYSRETALRAQRRRDSERRRGASMELSTLFIKSLPWSVVGGVLCLGHLVSCIYALFALFESHGGAVRTKFWLGRTNGGSRTAPHV